MGIIKLRHVAVFAILVTLLCIVAIGLALKVNYDAVEKYIRVETQKYQMVTNLYRNLGYGYGIHNFKNYVLRGDKGYYKKAKVNLAASINIIEGYLDTTGLSQLEIDTLHVAREVFKTYRDYLEIAKEMQENHEDVQKIDRAVRIDDTPAILNLQAFEEELNIRKGKVLSEFRSTQSLLLNSLMALIGSLFISILLLTRRLSISLNQSFRELVAASKQIMNGHFALDKSYYRHSMSGNNEMKSLATCLFEMGQSIDKTYRKMEKSNEDLKNFAFVASHDLKSPIKNIYKYCELIDLEAGELLNAPVRKYLESIKGAASGLLSLLDSILKYSLYNNQEVKMDRVDINLIVEQAISDLESMVDLKNAQIVFKTCQWSLATKIFCWE